MSKKKDLIELNTLVKQYPNDQDLGRALREIVNSNKIGIISIEVISSNNNFKMVSQTTDLTLKEDLDNLCQSVKNAML